MLRFILFFFFFFFNDTATTEIYTLSLHDALPISLLMFVRSSGSRCAVKPGTKICTSGGFSSDRSGSPGSAEDRKSTRLNSSHSQNSYAVFCLKKKKKKKITKCRSQSHRRT